MKSVESLPALITPSEAAALLCRPTRGRKIHTSSILRWGKQNRFALQWCNGWKVDRDTFIAWARASYRLQGHGRPAVKQVLRARRRQQEASAAYLQRTLGI